MYVIICVQQYLETGEVDIPVAEVEPLLACVPCPVLDMPESLLGPPYQAIVTKRNQVKHIVSHCIILYHSLQITDHG